MALIQSFEKTGNILFKYRGQIPAVIFLLSLPFIYFTDYSLFPSLFPGSPLFDCLLLPLALAISLFGFAVRCYTIATTPRGTSGRNTQKQVALQLNTRGIYSIVRHPLYLGNYLMWAGLLLFTLNIPLILIISLVYWLYYERIMFAEEAFLTEKFGQEYLQWSMEVPAFIPAFRKFRPARVPFSFKSVLRREYTGFFAMVFAYSVVDYWRQMALRLRLLGSLEGMDWVRPSLFVLLAALLLMLLLRALKHHTHLLDPDENRD